MPSRSIRQIRRLGDLTPDRLRGAEVFWLDDSVHLGGTPDLHCDLSPSGFDQDPNDTGQYWLRHLPDLWDEAPDPGQLMALYPHVSGGGVLICFVEMQKPGSIAVATAALNAFHDRYLAEIAPDNATRRSIMEDCQSVRLADGEAHGIEIPMPVGYSIDHGRTYRAQRRGKCLRWGLVWQLSYGPLWAELSARVKEMLTTLGHLVAMRIPADAVLDDKLHSHPACAAGIGVVRRLLLGNWWATATENTAGPTDLRQGLLSRFDAEYAAAVKRVFSPKDVVTKLTDGTPSLEELVELPELARFEDRMARDVYHLRRCLRCPGPAVTCLGQTDAQIHRMGSRIAILDRDSLGWPIGFCLPVGQGAVAVMPGHSRGQVLELIDTALRTDYRPGIDWLRTTVVTQPTVVPKAAPATDVPGVIATTVPSSSGPSGYMNPTQAARYLGISRMTFYRRLAEGKFTPRTLSGMRGKQFFSVAELDAQMRNDTGTGNGKSKGCVKASRKTPSSKR